MVKIIIHNGIRRSGNHVFCSWIKQHSKTPLTHINDIKEINYQKFVNLLFQSGPDYSDNKLVGMLGSKTIILTFEDQLILPQNLNLFQQNFPDVVATIIVRNPFNVLASLYKFDPSTLNYFPSLIQIWKQHADILLGQLSLDFLHPFLYEKYILDEKYREKIIKILDFKQNLDANPDDHGKWGWSSFDNSDFNNRWKEFRDDTLFINKISESEKNFIKKFESEKNSGENILHLKNIWKNICDKFKISYDKELDEYF